jgi:4-amino-4-deoxy-L-arabinose transferase-like glycosyltransferase
METSTIAGTPAQAGEWSGMRPGNSPGASSATKPINKRLLYAALFLVGFALRFGFVLWRHTYLRAPGSYLPFGAEICQIAKSIVEGRGYSSPFFGGDTGPTSWIAPVYPLLCAGVFRLFGVYSVASAVVLLFLQCLMAAATSIAIYALGARTVGARAGLWAAWIWAVSPIFFRWPVSWIWDFTVTALLVCVVLITAIDVGEKGTLGLWLRMAAIWALIALTNPAPLSVMPFAFLYAACENHKAGKRWMRSLVISCVLFRSNYWFEFYLGNYHFSNGVGFSGKHPNNNPKAFKQYAELGELRFVELHKKEALDFVRKYPREFLSLTATRTMWFWDGTPLRYQTNEWWQPWEFWPLSAAGWAGLLFVLTRRPRGWQLFLALLLIYPIPYYLAYPNAKYRHAIEPLLLLLGVYFASVLWGEVTGLFALRRTSQ